MLKLHTHTHTHTHTHKTKEKKTNVYDTDSELYNVLLEIYFYEYKALSDVQKKKKVG